MAFRLPILALVFYPAFIWSPASSALAHENTIKTVWSPHHRYKCHIKEGALSGESVIFTDTATGQSENLLTTDRWAEVYWSPDDAWFGIDDARDPDNNRLHVYHVFHNGTTEIVWSSLETAPDTYWKFLGWCMDKGMVRVQCDYRKDYNRPSKLMTKTYLIPIFLPEQVTGDDVGYGISADSKKQKQK